MTTTTVAATTVPAIGHAEAMALAATEFDRMLDLVRGLTAEQWQQPTVCDPWDVRAMVHMWSAWPRRRPRCASSSTTSAARASAAAAR
jgi:hypothetical protein